MDFTQINTLEDANERLAAERDAFRASIDADAHLGRPTAAHERAWNAALVRDRMIAVNQQQIDVLRRQLSEEAAREHETQRRLDALRSAECDCAAPHIGPASRCRRCGRVRLQPQVVRSGA